MTIIETFLAHQNPENASGMKRYMKNHFEFLGIKNRNAGRCPEIFCVKKPKRDVLTGCLWISYGP